jgi:hypothetical protein
MLFISEKAPDFSNLLVSIGNDTVLLRDQLVAPGDKFIFLFKKNTTALNRSFEFLESDFVFFDDIRLFFDQGLVFLVKNKLAAALCSV